MDSLANAVTQGVRQTSHHKHRRTLWAKRIVGMAIVVSGGTLLTSDLLAALRSDQVPPTAASLARTAP